MIHVLGWIFFYLTEVRSNAQQYRQWSAIGVHKRGVPFLIHFSTRLLYTAS